MINQHSIVQHAIDQHGELHRAHRLADASDAISLARFLALDLVVETKPDATPVTDADHAIERAIRAILSNERADDLIIGEEFGGIELLEAAKPGTRFWIIDPIDGTKNFLRGVPTWATLIASGTITDSGDKALDIGLVSAPALGRRWWAERGLGAYLTENFAAASPFRDGANSSSEPITRKISVSKVSAISDASLSYSDLIGWDSGSKQRRAPFLTLLDQLWRTRALGDFLSHMLVAEGAVDIAVEPALALWDMAALAVIVEEAGGRFTSLDGEAGPFGASGLSTNGLLHQAVLTQLNGR